MKLMICQPMRGKTNEQIRKEREQLIKKLESEGHEVIDTIISEDALKDSDEAIYYLSKSIEFLSKADGLVLMPGWSEARGCIIENRIALEYGKFVRYVND